MEVHFAIDAGAVDTERWVVLYEVAAPVLVHDDAGRWFSCYKPLILDHVNDVSSVRKIEYCQ
jgi:hypothetical protein